jgi:hypothetical protein
MRRSTLYIREAFMRRLKRLGGGPALLVFGIITLFFSFQTAFGADIPRITKEQARDLNGRPGVVFLDVRTEASWKDSGEKILGAFREDPNDSEKWASKYPKDSTLILYCT